MKNHIEARKAAEKPEDVINMIKQEVYMMGGNDYEIPALNNLLERLKKGEIDPAEAIAEARAIQASKQDYH